MCTPPLDIIVGDPVARAVTCATDPAETLSARSATAEPGTRPATGKVAVIICHGMGQQVRFETVDCVAKALLREDGSPDSRRTVRVNYGKYGDIWLPRAELELNGPDGPREVHLFEIYWAPLTEGQANAWDVTKFLFNAGLRGIRYALAGSFDRYIFGQMRSFRLQRRTVLGLLLAFVIVLLVWAAYFAILISAAVTAVRVLREGSLAWPTAGTLLAALLALWATLYCRAVYIQYGGDAAIYVASHRVTRFFDLRNRIKQAAYDVAAGVYGARTPDGDEFEYRDVIMVGHSLGSVIAYDTLNGMLNEDKLPGSDLLVRERTRMLLTLGSPLDKTAFIFRTQVENAPVREALAAATQPLIQSYDERPDHWVNLWSPLDPVSGPLDYYDAAIAVGAGRGERRVRNFVDKEAHFPILAHTEYLDHQIFARILHHSAIGIYT